jgi:hypothetical protein
MVLLWVHYVSAALNCRNKCHSVLQGDENALSSLKGKKTRTGHQVGTAADTERFTPFLNRHADHFRGMRKKKGLVLIFDLEDSGVL